MSFTYVLDIHVHHIHIRRMTALAKYLEHAGKTDAYLASKVGCDRSMITKIRAGTATPSLPLAIAISSETGVAVEALLPLSPAVRRDPKASA